MAANRTLLGAELAIEKPQEVVDFGKGRYGTPWTGITYPLLDRYCRGQTRDHINLRPFEDVYVLSRIGGQALQVSALTFGKEDIKGKGGFS